MNSCWNFSHRNKMLEIAYWIDTWILLFHINSNVRWISFHLSLSISVNFLEKKLCEKCLRQYRRCFGKRNKQYFIKLKISLINSKVFLLFMYLSILSCNVYNNLHYSMVRIFFLYRTASPDNDTRLQLTDINKTFDLHIKFVFEALHCINRTINVRVKYGNRTSLSFDLCIKQKQRGMSVKSKLHY